MDFVQPIAAIVLVLALLGGTLLLLKKRGGASVTASHWLEVVERVSLGPQHSLHLVRAGGRVMLVVTGPNSCHLVDYPASAEERI
jgi:flagellar biogenesis protein FliO